MDDGFVMIPFVTIELDGPPRGKGRPRAMVTKRGFAHVYTDDKTVKYETQLRYVAAQEMAGRAPTDQPVSLNMTVRFAVPSTWSKKKTADALSGYLRPTVKPDADNTLKLTDALNGIVWQDDKQVVDVRLRKVYAAIPGLSIEVMELGPQRKSAPRLQPAERLNPPDEDTSNGRTPEHAHSTLQFPVTSAQNR